MTANYFSPASSYATDPAEATQIQEFRDLVDSIHNRDMAVIIDVVYNHVGEPAHLLFVDKCYYFHLEPDGEADELERLRQRPALRHPDGAEAYHRQS